MKYLVTGATGFIGKALVTKLLSHECEIVVSSRSKGELRKLPLGTSSFLAELTQDTDWYGALEGVDVIIHTAARAHIMDDDSPDPLRAFRQVNVKGTLNLAKQAVAAGVSRFIFISSIGVNGNNSTSPFLETDLANPREPYAISKHEAEVELEMLAKESDIEVVVIRPPLVYGPQAPGNFKNLVTWIVKGVPLPLGAVYNQRSLVALDNLVSFIIHCINHPKAANKVFLISDGEDVSTTDLIRRIAKAFGKKVGLLPIPVSWMIFVAKLVGKANVTERLFGSLQVDSSKARDLLGWKPVVTMDEQLKKIAENYPNNEKTI